MKSVPRDKVSLFPRGFEHGGRGGGGGYEKKSCCKLLTKMRIYYKFFRKCRSAERTSSQNLSSKFSIQNLKSQKKHEKMTNFQDFIFVKKSAEFFVNTHKTQAYPKHCLEVAKATHIDFGISTKNKNKAIYYALLHNFVLFESDIVSWPP